MNKVKGLSKTEASLLKGLKWSTKARALIVWGERCLVTLAVSAAASESRLVDTVKEGFGLLHGVCAPSAPAQGAKRQRRLQPTEAVIIFGASVAGVEQSLPVPFERKCFHK